MSHIQMLKWERDQLESLRVIQISQFKLGLKPHDLLAHSRTPNTYEFNEKNLRKSLLSFRLMNQAKSEYYTTAMRIMHTSLSPKLLKLSRDLHFSLIRSGPPMNPYLRDLKLMIDQILFDLYDFNFKNSIENPDTYRLIDTLQQRCNNVAQAKLDQVVVEEDRRRQSILNASQQIASSGIFKIAQDSSQPVELLARRNDENNKKQRRVLKEIKLNKPVVNNQSIAAAHFSPKRILPNEKFEDELVPNFKRFRVSS